jgi:hypothetical protein
MSLVNRQLQQQQIGEFQEEQFAIVCERMAEGETLSQICRAPGESSRTKRARAREGSNSGTSTSQTTR